MKLFSATALSLALLGAPAFAEGHATGDAEAGEAVFKKCTACHSVVNADGDVLVKGGKNGPNLYGISGRVAGTDDFKKYGKSLVEAGENGLAWDEEQFVSYVADPKKFLVGYLDNKRARSNMSFKLRDEDDAKNVWAFIVSVGPDAADSGS